MNQLLKNKPLLIAVAVVALLLVIGAGYFLFTKQSKGQSNLDANAYPTQVPIPIISADSLGLSLKVGVPDQTVVATIKNTDNISAVEYELDYTAIATTKGSDNSRIPRAVIGEFDLTKKPVSKEIKLGTCSDVCHYDSSVQDVKLVLKVTKSDGKIYQSEVKLASVSQ